MYQIGEVIKRTRESLGLTQEALCDGICSVETLSRIENGRNVPSRSNFQALMERMGKCGERYLPFLRSDDMELLEELQNIERIYGKRKYEKVDTLLDLFEKKVDMKESVNRQLVMRMRALNDCRMGRISQREKRERLIQALRCTMPDFDVCQIPFTMFSRCEIRILCNIGVSYAEEGNLQKAIEILRKAEQYFRLVNIDRTERSANELTFLSNLSQTLGRAGETEEALEMGEKGIELCLGTGEGLLLALFLYNAGFEMEILGDNKEACKEKMLQAYYLAELYENEEQMTHIAAHWKKQYGTDITQAPL